MKSRYTILGKKQNHFRRLHVEKLDSRELLAVDFELVKDINTTTHESSSEPDGFLQIGNVTYFTAETPGFGTELWKTDGTASGTVLVKDIAVGDAGSAPRSLTDVHGTLFFVARNSLTGNSLWKSDGTESGTVLVKDVVPGPDYHSVSELTNVNGILFFSAYDAAHGTELWRSDGTEAGTWRLADTTVGPGSSFPRELTNVNGVLYFYARDAANTSRLWKSDGTMTGTQQVFSDRPGGFFDPRQLTSIGGKLYFTAISSGGEELWRSDGTSTGTFQLRDINPGNLDSRPRYITEFSGLVYFFAKDDVGAIGLWKSDGSELGTTLVTSLSAGNSFAPTLVAAGSYLYFPKFEEATGRELWRSDGSEMGTVRITDLYPGSEGSRFENLTALGDILYFSAESPGKGEELWRSDGSINGTFLVKDIFEGEYGSYPYNMVNANGRLLFSADDGVTGFELWASDGSQQGTVLVKDLNTKTGDAYPTSMVELGGSIYFIGDDGISGKELWKTDGTSEGTVQVKDILVGEASQSGIGRLTRVNDSLFFEATDGVHGWELWKSDGTPGGTSMVRDIIPGWDGGGADDLTNVNGVLFFTAYEKEEGSNILSNRELWTSDGTEQGTRRVKDINIGVNGSLLGGFTNVNDTLYFFADDGISGTELWKSDGTESGTVLVKDILVGTGSSNPRYLKEVNGTLFFVATDGTSGRELWRTDGTESGTVRVKDMNPGFGDAFRSYATILENVDGILYFGADDGASGNELWRSDGTEAGTYRIQDIEFGATGSRPSWLTNVNGTLYFRARQISSGIELWRSDGTSTGTMLVKDIAPGSASAYPATLKNVYGKLYFSAFDAVHGDELWSSDGTEAGTELVYDFTGNGSSGNPWELTPFLGNLLVTASSLEYGNELFLGQLNFAPVDLALSNSNIAENSPSGALVGLLSSIDPNVNSTFSYSLVDGSGDDDNSLFAISGNALQLVGSVDFETQPTFSVRMRTTDQWGSSFEKAFDLVAIDVNEKPTLVINQPATHIAEVFTNARIRMADVAIRDDALGTNSLVIAGPDAALFEIVGNTLALRSGVNVESTNHPELRITVSVDDPAIGQTPDSSQELVFQVVKRIEGTSGSDVFGVSSEGPLAVVTRSSNRRPAVSMGRFPKELPLTLNGLEGLDTVLIQGNASDDEFTVRDGAVAVAGMEIRPQGVESIVLAGGQGNDTYRFAAHQMIGQVIIDELVGGTDTLDFSPTLNRGIGLQLGIVADQIVAPGLTLRLQRSNTIENVIGTNWDDHIVGNSLGNRLVGLGGNDRLEGLNGNDQLEGNSGNDQLFGGTGNDSYLLDADTQLNSDWISDPSGIDHLDFSETTSEGISLSLASNAVQNVNSRSLLQIAVGTNIESISGSQQADTLIGNASANILDGGGGNDALEGGIGNDTYRFMSDLALGTDTIIDQGGIDTLDFSEGSQFGVNVSLVLLSEQVINSNLSLILNSASTLENLIGSQANDVLIGNALANRFIGNAGDDQMNGGAGSDTYYFEANEPLGLDVLGDPSGADTLDFSPTAAVGIQLDLGKTAIQSVNSLLQIRLLANDMFENLVGSSQNDILIGNGLANSLRGGAGNDELLGLGGNDRLVGNGGDDLLDGGLGDNILDFDTDLDLGSDTVRDSLGIDTLYFGDTKSRRVSVNLGITTPQTINSGLTMTIESAAGIENVVGGALDDSLTGNVLSNRLVGGAGNDLLVGGLGDDSYAFDVDVALGSDAIIDQGGFDTLDFSASTTNGIEIDLALSGIQIVRSDRLLLTLGSDDALERVIGSSRNDRISGNAASNVLLGGSGDDILLGANGRDVLIGGLGSDSLDGGEEEDLLISGTTIFDSSQSTMLAIRNAWTAPENYETRTNRLRMGLDGVPAMTRVTAVKRDASTNVLLGGVGRDWFFANLTGGTLTDAASDLETNELVEEL